MLRVHKIVVELEGVAEAYVVFPLRGSWQRVPRAALQGPQHLQFKRVGTLTLVSYRIPKRQRDFKPDAKGPTLT